ncbi:MAG TPA: methyltransferase domain-containing protein, partial [Thermoanaerobaculia bacterium]|nr:methyltransferase domain-containing protein [Thermoanaerobaculia bacterium]
MSELRRLWENNAAVWTDSVREHAIESRRLVTDAAVLSAVLEHSPHTVLDLGCGEGWLSRALSSQGIRVTGVDFSLPLACAARAVVATYDALPFARSFDIIVANFSLLDD